MLEGVSIADAVDFGGWGVLALFVGLGFLIPRWTHNQRVADKDAQITYLREIVAKREEQLSTALSANEVVLKLLEDIKRAAEVPR